jgi:glycosyltransferase involved in cell wall biosynthesis
MSFSKDNSNKLAEKLAFIWYGPVYSLGGYGSVSRLFVSNLVRLGFKVKVVSYGSADKSKLDKTMVKLLENCENNEIPEWFTKILIQHQLPDNVYSLRFSGVDYSVLMTIFETDSIPKNWVRICNKKLFDEIWIPTTFNFKTFSKAGVKKDKLRIVNYGLEHIDKSIGVRRGKNGRRFRFLYIADLIPRKNIPLLITAFNKEFKNNKDVELFIQLSYSSKLVLNEFMSKYDNLLNNSNIIIGKDRLTENQVASLIASADVYISLDKANGWGMPCMEAMSYGVLSATIDWSGSTEFMKEDNSLLIKPSKLEPVDPESALLNPIYCKQKWAHVPEYVIRKTMRNAYENNKKLQKLSEKAKMDIRRDFDIKHIIDRLAKDLKTIGIKNKNSDVFIKRSGWYIVLLNEVIVNLRYNLKYLITYRSTKLMRRTLKVIFWRLSMFLSKR